MKFVIDILETILYTNYCTPQAQIAQSVEQRTENPRVGSSILSLGTNIAFAEVAQW